MPKFRAILIDLEVHKRVEADRRTFAESPNDIVRRLLGLAPGEPVQAEQPPLDRPGPRDLVVKAVRFPEGASLRMAHKGKTTFAEIGDGAIWVNGKAYKSPSAAAIAVAGTSVNGWRLWEMKLPGEERWIPIDALRRRSAV